jgi:hypothetical protein
MTRDDIDHLLALTRHSDPRTRRRAVRELCPCAVRANLTPVWDRLLEMHTDADASVRSLVLHSLCDGSPASREGDVVAAVEAMQQDPDVRLRRRARGIIAAYRRTGKINQL